MNDNRHYEDNEIEQTPLANFFICVGLFFILIHTFFTTYIQIFQKKIIFRTTGVPYLIRWTVFGIGRDCKYGSIKVHKVMEHDDDCLHDHPFPFISIILKGGYWEHVKREISHLKGFRGVAKVNGSSKDNTLTIGKFYKPGKVLYRPASHAHRLELKEDIYGLSIPCWTLVFTGPKSRRWGFITKNGWIHWREYSSEKC